MNFSKKFLLARRKFFFVEKKFFNFIRGFFGKIGCKIGWKIGWDFGSTKTPYFIYKGDFRALATSKISLNNNWEILSGAGRFRRRALSICGREVRTSKQATTKYPTRVLRTSEDTDGSMMEIRSVDYN